MTPELMADLVARWVRFYTRDLPPPVAERRIGEIEADLHDHIAHERSRGTSDPRIAAGIATRMLRGVAADVSWQRDRKEHPMVRKPVTRIALATAFVLSIPLLLMLVTNDVNWGVFDFVFAAVVLGGTGLLLHQLIVRRSGNLVLHGVAAAIGVAAIVLGEMDDAPGLVGFGLLLILGTAALAVRSAQRT